MKDLNVNKVLMIMFSMIAMIFLAGMAHGFEMTNPSQSTYNTTTIPLSIVHNETLENITYSVDGANATNACSNCSSYNTTLNLTEGSHTINAFGYIGNETFIDNANFTIDLPEPVVKNFTLSIIDPDDKTYNYSNIFYKVVSNETLDNIKYSIDNGSLTLGCSNCSSYNNTVNLTDGSHKITFVGTLENVTKNVSVNFKINTTNASNNTTNQTNFTVNIVKPESKKYNTTMIPIDVETNKQVDKLTIWIVGKYNYTCYNCSGYETTLNLSKGSYVLRASGVLNNQTINASRYFEVGEYKKYNYTYNGSKYVSGFEKLPKMVQNGEISDSELANILRNNRLPPGIVNRLIKTGMLGEESIDAILDTQFTPPGILKKILKYVGIKQDSFAQLICQEYNLSSGQKSKILLDNGITVDCRNKIKMNFEDDLKKHSSRNSDDEDEDDDKDYDDENKSKGKGKSYNIGKQVKSYDDNDNDDDSDEDDDDNKVSGNDKKNGKTPPGLEKKNGKSNNGKGKGKNK